MKEGCGLFVDLDGTLADSLSVMRQVYRRFLSNHGRPDDDGEFDRLNGPPLAQVVGHLARDHGLAEPLEILVAQYWQLIEQAYESVAPMAGAAELLAVAREFALPVALVTSNDGALAARWLARVGLADGFTAIIGGADVTHGKPDPEPYHLALRRTGCRAAVSWAVEDSGAGVRAAHAAGLQTFHLGSTEWPDLATIAGQLRRDLAQ